MPPRRNKKAVPTVQQAPVEQPQAPVQQAQAPVQQAQAHVQHAQAPVQHAQAPVQPPQPPVQPARPTLIEIGVELRFRIKVSRVVFPCQPKSLRQKKTARLAVKSPVEIVVFKTDPAPDDVAPVKGARKARGAPKRILGRKPKEEDDNLADKPRKRKRQAQEKEDSDVGYESDLPAKKKRQTKKLTRAEEEGSGKGAGKPGKGRGRAKKAAEDTEESHDRVDELEEPKPAPKAGQRKRKQTKKEKQEEEDRKGKWVVKDIPLAPAFHGQYIGEMRPARQEWTFVFHPWTQTSEEPPAQQAKGKAKKVAKKPVPQVPGVGLPLAERLDAWHDANKKATPFWLINACRCIHFPLQARKKGQRGKIQLQAAPDSDADDAEEEEEEDDQDEDDQEQDDDDLDQEPGEEEQDEE
ncbi:MAG: hypothetical protein Q9212_001398 [Teloschistes hypoglaucus]